MDALPKSRLLRFVERAMVLARRAVTRFSTRYSRKRFTLRQHVVRLCLKVKKTTTYRDLVDELIEMPRIRDALDLNSIPAPSTLCKAFDLECSGSVETFRPDKRWRAQSVVRIDHATHHHITIIFLEVCGLQKTHRSR